MADCIAFHKDHLEAVLTRPGSGSTCTWLSKFHSSRCCKNYRRSFKQLLSKTRSIPYVYQMCQQHLCYSWNLQSSSLLYYRLSHWSRTNSLARTLIFIIKKNEFSAYCIAMMHIKQDQTVQKSSGSSSAKTRWIEVIYLKASNFKMVIHKASVSFLESTVSLCQS